MSATGTIETKTSKRVLAVASAGGHWLQLCKITEPSQELPLVFVTTIDGLVPPNPKAKVHLVTDCNRNEWAKVVRCTLQMVGIMLRERPALVVTTGAMPGLLAIATARLLRIPTLWIDSIANAEELSASGRAARRFAHTCVSQWEHVAQTEGVTYEGRIL